MMLNKSLLLMGIFGILGILVLIASAISVNGVSDWANSCPNCGEAQFRLAAGALGIIAGALQINFCLFELLKPGLAIGPKYWLAGNAVVLVLTLMSFAMSVHFTMSSKRSYVQFFNVVTCLDWIFCFVAILVDQFIFKFNR